MLTMKKEITLTGESKIEGVVAESYRAVINSENPNDMLLTSTQRDKALYKANRTVCRADEVEFEEAAFTLQDKMLTDLEASTNETEEGDK